MKTNLEVANAFICGTSAAAGHLYTNGNTIVSYWTPIASRQNNGVILMTNEDYSNTTRRHKLHIRRAAKYMTMFEVPNIQNMTESKHKANAEYLHNTAKSMYQKASRARKPETKANYERMSAEFTTDALIYESMFILKSVAE